MFHGDIDLTVLPPSTGFIIQGAGADDHLGRVCSAGDINGDGFDDVIVGAYFADEGGFRAGAAYVVFGKDSGLAFGDLDLATNRQVVDLRDLSPADGFIIQGDQPEDLAGVSVSSAGDVNGDGFDDIIVGAVRGDDGGPDAGEAYLIFGKAAGPVFGNSPLVLDLGSLGPNDGFIIQGGDDSDQLGRSVSSAGDVNGDGVDDLIVGAPYSDDGGDRFGEAYVVFGKALGPFGRLDTGTDRQVVDIDLLDAAAGFVIRGDTSFSNTGTSISSAGDVNGDGVDDLIIGADLGDLGGNNAGQAYVIFGDLSSPFGSFDIVTGRRVLDLSTLGTDAGFIIQGDGPIDVAGRSVASAGDINDDGVNDLIIGAPLGDDGAPEAGEAYVIFGKESGAFGQDVTQSGVTRRILDLTGLAPSDGFIIQGEADGDRAARSVSAAGDFNGDGVDDLLIGAYRRDYGGIDAGGAYVVYGKPSGSAFGAFDSASGRQILDLSALDGRDGFVIQGDTADDLAGIQVAAAGDVNGDGGADIIIAASTGDDGGVDAGEAYVIFGTPRSIDAIDDAGTTSQGAPVTIDVRTNDTPAELAAGASYFFGSPSAGTLTQLGGSLVTFDPSGAFHELDAGETAVTTFNYIVVDVNGALDEATVHITVEGRDDPAFIAGDLSGELTEAGGVANSDFISGSVRGVAAIVDPDGPSTLQFNPVLAGTPSIGGFGGVEVAASGAWSYVLDNTNPAIEALRNGESIADSFILSVDGLADQAVTILINGADDIATSTNGTPLNDVLQGTPAVDLQNGLEGDDILIGGLGDDIMNGGAGVDRLLGQGGDDTLTGGPERDVFVFAPGDGGDTITDYEPDLDILRFNDALFGFADLAITDQGDDLVVATPFGEEVRLIGHAGLALEADDILIIRSPDAAGDVNGDGGDNRLSGTPRDDTINGFDGDDILIGGAGRDVLDGGAGADRLLGQAGDDMLTGGGDRDVFVFRADSGDDVVTDYEQGVDILRFNGVGFAFSDLTIGNDGANLRIDTPGGDSITLIGHLGSVLGNDDFLFA